MALTTNELRRLRLIIEYKPNSAYMEALAANDDFARAEMAAVLPDLVIDLNRDIAQLQNEIDKRQAKLTIINEE